MKATSSSDCRAVRECVCDYVENALSAERRAFVDAHMAQCGACRMAVKSYADVQGILNETLDTKGVSREYAEKMNARFEVMSTPPAMLEAIGERESFAGSLRERFSAAPWWAVSVVLHGLVIALAGLISMAIELPQGEAAAITVTELAPRPPIEIETNKPKQQESALHSKHETPPIDPTSKDAMNVVVPPELLKEAELGDHFETINPDRPDTHSAFGNPEAEMFHSTQGSDDAAGGGGSGGETLDDVVGVGGSSSPGSGGGWGNGHGAGIGNGNGSGRGSFGNRNGGGRKAMVRKHGGNKATEDAVERALAWLARHQEADGHWIPKKFGGGTAEGTCETGATGLALLAFLGAGHSEKVGKYKENVQRAVKWFIDNQGKNGVFECKTDRNGGRFYGHGIATMAMSEAASMANIPETRKAAQRGVDYISEIQIKTDAEGYDREGWDYDYTIPGKVSDTSLTSWMMLALKSAKVGGLNVDHRCFEGVTRWLDATQSRDPYKLGCWYRGTIAECLNAKQPDNPRLSYNNQASKEHALLAANATMRLYLGTPPHDARIVATAEHLVKSLPAWKPNGGTCFYHLYYGTLCMFQAGGPGWKTWNEALKNALLPSQCKGGDDDGSWDENADWLGKYGGRVYTTAMGCLCMEIYYRYAKLQD
ncbi:MAG TPA: zf-HC2 domain-containing protein [Planctomycetota bacterium]|nr:zf-HC2 domain-containing protein [Planctomycetota bacterium]